MAELTTAETSNYAAMRLTTDVVAVYVKKNAIALSDLPHLLKATHLQFLALANTTDARLTFKEPAVPIKKSITKDYLICLEDGAKLKMLKRYVRTRYSLTPDEYRERWGLPADYPMVAPSYSEKRSALAKKIGRGKRGKD